MIKADGYYIDSTEVTTAQYAIFQKLKGADTSSQTPECSWNTSFDPVFEPGAALMLPNRPVTNIDFCDAKAYCAWADERLCGRISGGALTLPETADATQSQWFSACGGPKSQFYPYGPAHQDGACNDNSMALLDVSAKASCQGYYPGLYDMLGNAQEWVDSCEANKGKTDACERIGGSYATGTTVTCSTSGAAERAAYSQSVGFRCCSVAPAKAAGN